MSETNGIAAKFAVYDTIGRASAYFVNDGILYNISVGGFVDEDNVDPANYLKELIDTFKERHLFYCQKAAVSREKRLLFSFVHAQVESATDDKPRLETRVELIAGIADT